MGLDHQELSHLAEEYASKHPREIIAKALENFEGNCAISFSGAEDVVLIDMATKISKNVRVFSLDTARLHRETYEFLETLRKHYDIPIEVFFPKPEAVQELVKEKGLYSFRQDGHKECCGVRKVEPLRRALSSLGAWVTGQRKDQSPGTRQAVPVIQVDPTFGSDEQPLIKFNPLANWTSKQVWAYIAENKVPFNPLHEQGFISIGCEPCTRPVNPGEHERAGRWWWEEETLKECGLHAGNVEN